MVARSLRRASKIYKQEGIVPVLRGLKRVVRARLPAVVSNLKLRLRLLGNNEDVVEMQVNGSHMKIKTDEAGIHRDLLVSGVREPASTEAFRSLLQQFSEFHDENIYIFDIGANIGYYVLLEASLLEDCGQIAAIEPELINIDDLRENVNINGFENVDIYQRAVGSKRGTATLKISEKGNLHQIISEPAPNKQTTTVEVTSVDQLVSECQLSTEHPTVVRIDVEGYEGEVIKGMSNLLESSRPLLIFIEIHSNKIDQQEEEMIINSLSRNGLKLKFVSYDGGKTGHSKSEYDDIVREFTNKHIIAVR